MASDWYLGEINAGPVNIAAPRMERIVKIRMKRLFLKIIFNSEKSATGSWFIEYRVINQKYERIL